MRVRTSSWWPLRFSSNTRSSFHSWLLCLLRSLGRFGLSGCGGRCGCGLLRGGLFGFLIPFSHDILECGSNNGPLEFLGPLGTLLSGLFLNTLLMLTPVKHGPGHFSGIPLEKMSLHGTAIQKFVDLAILLHKSTATGRVNLVATVTTEVNLHGCDSKRKRKISCCL